MPIKQLVVICISKISWLGLKFIKFHCQCFFCRFSAAFQNNFRAQCDPLVIIIPPLSKEDIYGVRWRFRPDIQEIRNVICIIRDTIFVACLIRRQISIADSLSIDICLEDPQSSDIKHRPADWEVNGKIFEKYWIERIAILPADPFCSPFSTHYKISCVSFEILHAQKQRPRLCN